MSHALGIDVGGTASRWVLLARDGTVAARGAVGGGTGHLFIPEHRAIFVGVVSDIAQGLGGRTVGAVHAGITGFGSDVADDATRILGDVFGAPTGAISLTDDMDLAYAGVFAPGEGHLVAAGTGSIALHVSATGERVRAGGRGILVDDAGSGSWIALRAVDRLYRLIDRAGHPDGAEALAHELFAAAGGDSWDDVRRLIYGSDRGRIGTLAQLVATAADAGDRLALEILTDAGVELARLAQALIARTRPLPVAVVGGVVALHAGIRDAIAAQLPGIPLGFPPIDAALKAARLALVHLQPE